MTVAEVHSASFYTIGWSGAGVGQIVFATFFRS
jgi:hypothetical protein